MSMIMRTILALKRWSESATSIIHMYFKFTPNQTTAAHYTQVHIVIEIVRYLLTW